MFVKYPREKVEKQKMLKMLLFIISEAPQKISAIFWPFLAIFTLFHLKNWPYLQKPEFGNLAKTRFWFLLVNNSLCSIPLSWARSYNKETPGDRCDVLMSCSPGRAKSKFKYADPLKIFVLIYKKILINKIFHFEASYYLSQHGSHLHLTAPYSYLTDSNFWTCRSNRRMWGVKLGFFGWAESI